MTLISAWREHARAARPEPASQAPPVAHSAQSGPVRRSRRWPYIVGGTVAVVAIAVLLALALTGHLGTGANAATTSTGVAGGTASTTKVAAADVVAKVGGQAISRQQLEQKVADFTAQYPGQVPDKAAHPDQYKLFQEDVLDYLVAYTLATREAAALKITVTTQDVDAQMAFILKTSCNGDQATFDAAVKQQGLTMDQFKRIYGESMVFKKVYAEMTKDVTVTGATTDSTLLATKQQEAWRQWLAQQRSTVGVTYANGWTAPTNAGTLVP